MKDIENDNSDVIKRIFFYLVGFVLTSIGHMVFKGNSHTAPLSFPIIILLIISSFIWLITDYLNYKRKEIFIVHITGLIFYLLTILILIT